METYTANENSSAKRTKQNMYQIVLLVTRKN